MSDEHKFLLQKVQPAMVGLVDGSLSTLAPIFSIALATHDTRYAFIAGLANYHAALYLAVAVVAFELIVLAYFRYRFFQDTFVRALGIVTFAGVLIAAISAGLGSLLGTPAGG